jgi:hypothetical protein
MVEAPLVAGERKLMTEVAAKELRWAQEMPGVSTSLPRSSGEAVRLAKALGLSIRSCMRST